MKRYRIISDHNYIGLNDSYEVGESVRFKFAFATDTSYNCTINGCLLHPNIENGYLIYDFIMPECDVKIEVKSKNIMYRRIDCNE